MRQERKKESTMHGCFTGADILLPRQDADFTKWAMVACDQYTSQIEYWIDADRFVGSAPSTLRLILPEAYLGKDGEADRVAAIHDAMERYLSDGVLTRAVENGFVLTERTTASGIRLGLVGKIDLECYDYTPGAATPIRATEETVADRIPPRMRIREGAPLELPHIMVLVDDPGMTLVEPVYAGREKLPVLYDTELFGNGGHIRGYAVAGADARALEARLASAQEKSGGFFLAMGDGNHSLAVAKACWEKLKPTLSPAERETHPARFALAELVNLHSPALLFKPIHRILTGCSPEELSRAFAAWLAPQGMGLEPGEDVIFFRDAERSAFRVTGAGDRLPVGVLQPFLDAYLKAHPECGIDYIHGSQALTQLVSASGGCGILLPPISKASLFPAIRAGGVLPRKTFSMGSAPEKRYYMECRKIL